jgi:glycosyltransferase involved in cell wall biosynthesis
MQLKPKIAVIGLKGLPAFGGAAAVGENIINELKNEFNFTVFSVASHTLLKTGTYNGVKQIVFKNHGTGGLNTLLYYIKSLLYCLFIERFHLIHLHHAESGFITPFLRLKYFVIVTFHGVHKEKSPKFNSIQNKFFSWSEKQNVRRANHVISVSKPDTEFILKKYNKKITHIPNGITITEYQKNVKTGKDEYILFAAARVFEIKGLHIILQALHKIKFQGKLTVVGDIDQVPAYKQKIQQLSIGLNIEYIGLIKEKNKLFNYVREAKLFIFPSLTEAMSMMLLEVVSQKTPIIASDIPSNKAILEPTQILFFESKNADDLADKIIFALNNPSLMEHNAQNAYTHIVKSYTWPLIAKNYKNIFDEILKQSSAK